METKDKISKIEKIEGDKKAQNLISSAQNATNTKSAKAKTTSAEPAKKATEVKKDRTFDLGKVTASDKKITKIESFFAKLTNIKDKNDFLQSAILRHIKKCKKKFKKS